MEQYTRFSISIIQFLVSFFPSIHNRMSPNYQPSNYTTNLERHFESFNVNGKIPRRNGISSSAPRVSNKRGDTSHTTLHHLDLPPYTCINLSVSISCCVQT